MAAPRQRIRVITSFLALALASSGVGCQDEGVIVETPSAPASAAAQSGAQPVLSSAETGVSFHEWLKGPKDHLRAQGLVAAEAAAPH